MTEEGDEIESVAARRSGPALLLTRTPFELLLRGTTVAELEEAVPTATVPRGFALKLRGGDVILRKHPGASSTATGFVVKARAKATSGGARLAGHQGYLLDRIYFAFLSVGALLLAGLAGGFALSEGPGSAAVLGLLTCAAIPVSLALLILALQRSAVARQDARAREILRSVVAPA